MFVLLPTVVRQMATQLLTAGNKTVIIVLNEGHEQALIMLRYDGSTGMYRLPSAASAQDENWTKSVFLITAFKL